MTRSSELKKGFNYSRHDLTSFLTCFEDLGGWSGQRLNSGPPAQQPGSYQLS